ncbi:acetyl-CoA acetyltransferase [Parapedomonas caeni]
MTLIDPRTPVIVGVAQYGDRVSEPDAALTPLAMLEKVARDALADSGADSGAAAGALAGLDWLTVIRTFPDSAPVFKPPFWGYTNLPRSLANRLGASPARLTYPHAGGNTPQWFINMYCEAIARGEAEICLLAGVEALRTAARVQKTGIVPDWSEDPGGPAPEVIGDDRPGVSRAEMAHQMIMPTSVYPLFENALGHHYGRDPVRHRQALGALMQPFTEVAAGNPWSALASPRTAAELCEPSDDNRYIAYPYTKYFNANMFVDQAAAVWVMSTAAADRLGVPRDRRCYLHGAADTTEKWYVSERVNYYSSPAIAIGAAEALGQAGRGIADMALVDIYSCFPVAVEVAADAIGLAHADPRGLTVTGGLPYFGGPGNNYVTHSIAEMVARLRRQAGAFGLVTANGMYLTKHSFGVYSTTPTPAPFARVDPKSYQTRIDAMESPPLNAAPTGVGTIETFTVVYNRGAPASAPVIGRLPTGERFLGLVSDPAQAAAMVDRPVIGRPVQVATGETFNSVTLV